MLRSLCFLRTWNQFFGIKLWREIKQVLQPAGSYIVSGMGRFLYRSFKIIETYFLFRVRVDFFYIPRNHALAALIMSHCLRTLPGKGNIVRLAGT